MNKKEAKNSRAEYYRQQACWFRACAATHRIWCNCGDWQGHLAKYRGWCTEPKGHIGPQLMPVGDMLIHAGGGDGIPEGLIGPVDLLEDK